MTPTVDILPDSEKHFHTPIERLPEPLSHCELMPVPLSKTQSIFPCQARETLSILFFSAIWPTRWVPWGNERFLLCDQHGAPILVVYLPAGSFPDLTDIVSTEIQHRSAGNHRFLLPV